MPEFLTTKELAALLRIKERKVYDLAAGGKIPCTKVTGKLLFPKDEVSAWIEGARSGPIEAPRRELPPVLLGSHDPLLEWALRQSGSGLATFLDGSADGVDRFAQGEGQLAGLHLRDAATAEWNMAAVRERCAHLPCVLLHWATRRRGLVMRPELAGRLDEPGDLRGHRLVPRQPGAGAQQLTEQLLAEAGLDEGAVEMVAPARSETDAALAVQEGLADVALGLECVAVQYRLRFVPLVEERFDLLVDRRSWFEPPLQRLSGFCRSHAFAERARLLAGYDITNLGEVLFNAGPGDPR